MDKGFKSVTGVHLYLKWNCEILLGKRCNTGYEDGKYTLPSGHLEEGESVIDCLIREAKEELGIKLNKKDCFLLHVMHRKSDDDMRVDLFFGTRCWIGDIVNKEPYKCSDLRFFIIKDKLPGNIVPYIKSAITHIENENIYSEFGW